MDGPSGRFVDSDLPGNQGRIAFVALAVERRPLSHDELADIVWGEEPPERWKGSLAAVVSKIRTLITATGIDGRDAMLSSGGAYTLVLPAESWVDLEDAHRRLDRAEGALRHGDPRSATGDATVASSILRRPLLAGAESRWVEQTQARQSDALYRCLTTLATAWSQLGDHQLAVTIAESAVQLDPFRETGHRLLMHAEHARGDRGAALRAFARCEQLLADELGVRPSPETMALVEHLDTRSTGRSADRE
jgi:DNA-binding SARP family transcriptional activator